MKGQCVKKACFAFLLILILPLLFFLEYLAEGGGETDPAEKVQIMEKDRYNGYGLEENQQLSDTILYETEEVVCYSDRLITRFRYEPENFDYVAAAVKGVKRECPSIEEVYVLPIPPRVTVEDGYTEDRETYSEYLAQLSEKLADTAALVDVISELEAHGEEYLFFRTEESWTARGAYYGTSVLCEALGIEPFSLADYEEYMYNSFYGKLYQSSIRRYSEESSIGGQLRAIPDDQLYYYLLPEGANREELFKLEDGKIEKITRPSITPSRTGPTAFIGADYLWAVVQGDGLLKDTAEESLLLVCDGKGKILAPFLANYYKNVYVVNIKGYDGLSEALAAIVEKYNIKDFVLAQASADIGDRGNSMAMNGFINYEELEAGHR